MKEHLSRLVPQPLVGALVSALALLALLGSWIGAVSRSTYLVAMPTALLAVVLIVSLSIVERFPLHIRYHTKVAMTTVSLYLLATLLPPHLAGLAGGVGMLAAELLARAKRGTLPSDIATEAGRWVILMLFASLVAHLPAPDAATHAFALFLTAFVMFVGDTLTSALSIAPMCGEPPLRVVAANVREAGAVEGAQYLLGILGALAISHYPWALALLVLPVAIVYVAFKNVKEMREDTRLLLERMADAVDLRDACTGGHSHRVAATCEEILRQLRIEGAEANLIIAAARVHDIGKIGIPDLILHKPDRLTPEEWAIMKTHPASGAELLARYPDFSRGVDIVRHHHERWDGNGYPDGLKGLDIPFGARVIAVADSFDAMTSDRPYRAAIPVPEALEILRRGSGKQWDPAIVNAFLQSRVASGERTVGDLRQHFVAPAERTGTLGVAA